MRKGRTFLNLLVLLAFVLPIQPAAFAQESGGRQPDSVTPILPISQLSQDPIKDEFLAASLPGIPKIPSADGRQWVSAILRLEDASLGEYRGGVSGLSPTSPEATGAGRLNLSSADSQNYLNYLDARQAAFTAQVLAAAPEARVIHRYRIAVNGISVLIPDSQLEAIANLPGMAGLYLDELQHLDTERSPAFIGAPVLWEQLGGQESAGEGVVVGVIDSGIWPEHPSFSDPDPSGKPYAAPPITPGSNGFGSSSQRSTCDFGDAAANPEDAPFTCNHKLIGAYAFIDTYKAALGLDLFEFDSARDDNGHGTHTSSTAAGNSGVTAALLGSDRGTISGVAPRAHIIMYRACAGRGCFNSDILSGVEQAILDGVDVINFSISGGDNPYSDVVELAFRTAYENGVFVAASAGNSGPEADSVSHRGPWVTTIAASTTDRAFQSTLQLTAGDGSSLSLSGASITAGISTPTPVILPPVENELCNTPFAPGTFNGEIVICKRGVNARVEKSFNAAQGGAGGMILYNPELEGLATDNHFIPSIHLENDAGAALLEFLATHSAVTATFTPGSAETVQGDVIAPFSSRGGPGQTLGISKPDITAPGVQILAGHTPLPAAVAGGPDGQLFQAIQGTSMSSPHAAGSAALLKALHEDWTPGKIKSALMTTAALAVVKEDGDTPATPFDVGSGRVDLSQAGKASLTFDETAANYEALENELWKANYPSLYLPTMPGKITVERTVHNETGEPAVWELSVSSSPDVNVKVPRRIEVPANGDYTFKITVTAVEVPLEEVRHAMIEFEQGDERLHFPITLVRKQPVISLDKTCDPGSISQDEATNCTVAFTNNSYEEANVSVVDRLPEGLELVPGSVSGGQGSKDKVSFEGTLTPIISPTITLAPGPSPFGYLQLSIPPLRCNMSCDDTGFNFDLSQQGGVLYHGTVYETVAMATNGFVQLGRLTSATSVNQNLPNRFTPNNILAPFWTDLHLLGPDGRGGGTLYAAIVTEGSDQWLVLEWREAFEYQGNTPLYTFQVWLRTGGTTEEASFVYERLDGTGRRGRATVGAENEDGKIGFSYYYNGEGTLPAAGQELDVNYTPQIPGETHTITFQAIGKSPGTWTNCAELTSEAFFGTNIDCFPITVTEADPGEASTLP